MSILTYVLPHSKDFSEELKVAKKLAIFAKKNKSKTTKEVKHFGLKSVISNQIIRKYVGNLKCKKIHSVNLILPNQGIKYENQEIWISSLKFRFPFIPREPIEKINQIEISKDKIFIACSLKDEELKQSDKFIGIDLNTTGHAVVIGDTETGKVWKLGKKIRHIQNKYRDLRTYFQKKSKFRKLKQIKRRQSNITRDVNHKITRFIVNLADKLGKSIRIEDLTSIRQTAKTTKSFRYTLNSWPFYQFKMFLEYKAKKLGIFLQSIDPRYTSQKCSRCGHIEKANRNDKHFCCKSCNHKEHADVNASFNIANTSELRS